MILILYRIYQCCIMVPLMLVATALTSLIVGLGTLVSKSAWIAYVPTMMWGRVMCWLTLVRVEVHGRENIDRGQSYVFVANHQGAYDIFAVYGWLGHNFRWMMKKSLEKIPMVGWACKRMGQVFVDNKTPRGIADTMKAAEHLMARGMSIVVFPEGSRSFTGAVGKFKRGAFVLSTEFGFPVVPVTINGAFDVMSRTAKLPSFGRIVLTIHPAIPASDPDIIEHSREAILAAISNPF